MPPRKVAPARSPTSPPRLAIVPTVCKSAPVLGGKGSAFKVIKPLPRIQDVGEAIESATIESTTIESTTIESTMELTMELTAEEIEENRELARQYGKITEARIWLEEAIASLKIGYRREMGEVFPDDVSSSEEVDEEFNLNECEDACGVTPDEIIDFVWDYVPGIQVKFGSKRQMDYVLSCEPKDLLAYLVQALDEVAVQIGPDGIL
jgi:hypothetical protein